MTQALTYLACMLLLFSVRCHCLLPLRRDSVFESDACFGRQLAGMEARQLRVAFVAVMLRYPNYYMRMLR